MSYTTFAGNVAEVRSQGSAGYDSNTWIYVALGVAGLAVVATIALGVVLYKHSHGGDATAKKVQYGLVALESGSQYIDAFYRHY